MLNQVTKFILVCCIFITACNEEPKIDDHIEPVNHSGTYTGIMHIQDIIWRYSDTPPYTIAIDSLYPTTLEISHDLTLNQCITNYSSFRILEWSNDYSDYRHKYSSPGGYTNYYLSFTSTDSIYYNYGANASGNYYQKHFKGVKMP